MNKIAIHSVPRSSSTWLGNIFNSHPNVSFKYQPLFSYAFKNYLTTKSTEKEICSFFNNIVDSKDVFINQIESIEKGFIPKFEKAKQFTHSCYKEVRYHHILENMLEHCPDLKLILLVRNPLAVLYSWYKAPKEFRAEQGWVFAEEWLEAPKKNLNKPEEFNGYAKWKEATLIFHNLKERYPNQVFLLTYNQLISNTTQMVKQLFEFTELKMDQQTLQFIKDSQSIHKEDAYSVFKKRTIDDDWKQLPQSIIDYIVMDLKDTTLETYLHE
jgi:hypothetical protein